MRRSAVLSPLREKGLRLAGRRVNRAAGSHGDHLRSGAKTTRISSSGTTSFATQFAAAQAQWAAEDPARAAEEAARSGSCDPS
jgi:hypothetical protein